MSSNLNQVTRPLVGEIKRKVMQGKYFYFQHDEEVINHAIQLLHKELKRSNWQIK
tara:strand:+ start:105 stop:269 length:165 start_codon:yes stop_codon:yes gene_type:complete